MEGFVKPSLFIFLSSSIPVSSAHLKAPSDSDYTSLDTSDVLRTWKVRVAALVCSTCSMTASLIAFYWFCRMEKRFRHRSVQYSSKPRGMPGYLTDNVCQAHHDAGLWRPHSNILVLRRCGRHVGSWHGQDIVVFLPV
jgi:hypothetical protein